MGKVLLERLRSDDRIVEVLVTLFVIGAPGIRAALHDFEIDPAGRESRAPPPSSRHPRNVDKETAWTIAASG